MVIKKIIFPVCICTCLKIVGYLMIEGKKEYLLVKNNSKMIQTKRKSWQFLFCQS
jgi:hypothetical protein